MEGDERFTRLQFYDPHRKGLRPSPMTSQFHLTQQSPNDWISRRSRNVYILHRRSDSACESTVQ
jgi:hypothetical protein